VYLLIRSIDSCNEQSDWFAVSFNLGMGHLEQLSKTAFFSLKPAETDRKRKFGTAKHNWWYVWPPW